MPIKKGQKLNPTGKGGFQERPEDIGNGRPKHSPQYWLNQYGKLSNKEFKQLTADFNNGTLDDELTVNQVLALTHIAGAAKKLDNRKDLFNRVDGMPTQKTELTGENGGNIGLKFVIEANGYQNPKHSIDDATPSASIERPDEVQSIDMAQTSKENNNIN